MIIPRLSKLALAIALTLIAIAATAAVVLHNFDWNRARPWLNGWASEALGRPVTIAGDLTLSWEQQATVGSGWLDKLPWPHLLARDIHVGNPPWLASTQDMASIGQLSLSLSPLALLDKKLVIPVLRFDAPLLNLLRQADGKNNWSFANEDKPSTWQLELQRIVLSKGSVHLVDARQHADLTVDISSLDADPRYGVSWQLNGSFNGQAVSGRGKAGAVLSLQLQAVPYPIMANLRMGQTHIAVEGTLTKPADFAALDLRLKLSGVSMARLYALSGIVLPETPAFATEGHLIGSIGRHGAHWVYEHFTGSVGSSDISGSLDYLTKQPRPLLSGKIRSKRLLLADLAPLIGADSNASKLERGAAAIQPANKLLPVEQFKTERWTSIDADIDFSADTIIRMKELTLNKMTTQLRLKDGVLTLAPLNLALAGGGVRAELKLDASGRTRKGAILAELQLSARHLQLKQLLPAVDLHDANVGEINGSTSLSAQGNSVASLLGAANGEIMTLVDHGTVSKLWLEELGLNIGNVILTRLVGDKQVKLNCMVTSFGVHRGLMQSRRILIDTDDAIVEVTGVIDLAQEQLDLTIKPKSKGLRVFSLRAPLYVRGSFKQARVSVDKGVVALKMGGALALAVLSPIAILIPLSNAGPGVNSECDKVLANARQSLLQARPPISSTGVGGTAGDLTR